MFTKKYVIPARCRAQMTALITMVDGRVFKKEYEFEDRDEAKWYHYDRAFKRRAFTAAEWCHIEYGYLLDVAKAGGLIIEGVFYPREQIKMITATDVTVEELVPAREVSVGLFQCVVRDSSM